MKLAALIAVIGTVVLAAGWRGARLGFGLSAFFLLTGMIEYLSLRFGREEPTEESIERTLPAPGQFAPYLLRGERALGTTLFLSGRFVLVDLAEDEQLEHRKRIALELIENAADLAAAFEAFKRAEAVRNERYADSILGLQIEWISYRDTDPHTGEVYFTTESGENVWFCGLRGLVFDQLVMEA